MPDRAQIERALATQARHTPTADNAPMVPLIVRVPASMKTVLEAVAEERGCKVGDIVRSALFAWVAESLRDAEDGNYGWTPQGWKKVPDG